MNGMQVFYTSVLLVCVPFAVVLIMYARKHRRMPGVRSFIASMVCAVIYSVFYAAELNAKSEQAALFWFHLEHLPIPTLHYFWLMMSLEFVGLPESRLRLYRFAALAHPILYYAIYYTNPLHHLYISSFTFQSNGYFPVLYTGKGPLYALAVAFGTILGLIATVFYLRGYSKAPRLQRGAYVIMLVASLFPWAAVYANTAPFNTLGLDFFPAQFPIAGLLYTFGMLRYHIFNAIPIATETVFRHAREGVAIIDRLGQIVEANDAFLQLYPNLDGLSKKQSLARFIGAHREFEPMLQQERKVCFSRGTGEGPRHFSAELTNITTENGESLIGKILTIEDITLYEEHQRQLRDIAANAINRAENNELSFLQAQIKPHFLNNTLSVIASMITRSPDEAKRLIAELGEHLANCYYFDESSPMVSLQREMESVQAYVSIEKARFRDQLNFSIVGEEPPDLPVPRLCIQPLVENAIRHGTRKKTGKGNVWLHIEEEPDYIRFSIEDDGPGMDHETIAKLLHGTRECSGIGISNINRRLKKHYGEELQILSAPGKGTQVTFRVPRAVNGGTHD